ncbi:MAG: sigma-70 family RNA polymerase sigma factor [Thermoguttaceae bacterium]|nr:sigma-70 family RNA polymerase sigma factor [Thermoguttaceae bacterium]
MSDKRLPNQESFEAFFDRHHAELASYAKRKFPRLADEAEDLVQQAVAETLQRLRHGAFRPEAGWQPWLRSLITHRAIDRLRQWERRALARLAGQGTSRDAGDARGAAAGSLEVADCEGLGPPTQLAEAERRARQGLLLSQVLAEFCRWSERRPDRLALKEAYERSLRGQSAAQIAMAMGLDRQRIDQLLHRARTWVLDRVREADVDRSVFLTLHRRKPE